VDCVLADWSDWSTCSPFCYGSRSRNRSVETAVSNGGAPCDNVTDIETCSNFCMDCRLDDWTEWSPCSKSCEGGQKNRTRNEVYVRKKQESSAFVEFFMGATPAKYGYYRKVGFSCDKEHQRPLKDGKGLSPDAAEEACSSDETCAGMYDPGCSNFVGLCDAGVNLTAEDGSCAYLKQEIGGGGTPCDHEVLESDTCNTLACPVDCEWEDWSEWTACSPFCAGEQGRDRTLRVQAANGGVPCGNATELRDCTNLCVDCLWTEWTAWDTCSQSCNGGAQGRSRSVARTVQGGGSNCTGDSAEERNCSTWKCPVDCDMDDWSDWTTCVPHCAGTHARSRTIRVAAENGGVPCGDEREEERCYNDCSRLTTTSQTTTTVEEGAFCGMRASQGPLCQKDYRSTGYCTLSRSNCIDVCEGAWCNNDGEISA